MFMYKDEEGKKVIFYRERCRCYTKRDHIFTKRVQLFCCCLKEISWYKGLSAIAVMVIVFGAIEFILFNVVALKGAPSAIHSHLIFPFFSITILSQTIIFCILGILLWIGIHTGNLKLIKSFPWLLLVGYIFAAIYFVIIVRNGQGLVKTLVWSDYGMVIKSDPYKEKKVSTTYQMTFYILTIILILALVIFTTYIIILALSWIERLEIEVEDEIV